jgi:hydrogenase nickel incorporation protein HypA/HybF
MHELSLAEGVLQRIEESAARDGFTQVRTVWLEIGQLAAVAPDAMKFCWDAVSRGSIAEGARLEIIDVPGRAWCPNCRQTVPLVEVYAICPVCGGCQLEITSGTEMRVKELEVE